MKKGILMLTCFSLLAVGWWLTTGRSNKRNVDSSNEITTAPTPAGSAVSNAGTSNAAVKTKMEAMQEIWAKENTKPLDFYGKIVDQNNNPVERVRVRAGVGTIISFDRSGGRWIETESDSNGIFSFVGIRGAGMGPFLLSKEGYFYDGKLPSSSRPTNYAPNPKIPTAFVMWKLKGAEQMAYHKIHTYVPCDGTPTVFDVLTGKETSTGTLVITVTRMPLNIQRGERFDWKASVEIRDGGLTPIEEAYPYEAPNRQYQPTIAIERPATMANWSTGADRSYYFRSGKNFGRLSVNVQADFQPPPTSVDIEIYFNPSGSRNLEFDPKLKAKSR